jgi:hypothetical protein
VHFSGESQSLNCAQMAGVGREAAALLRTATGARVVR